MKWWPKFSIADLLWFTVAVALGAAITGTSEATSNSGLFMGLNTDMRWPDGLLATGCLLLLFALVQHGRGVLKASASTSTVAFALRLRACICFSLAAVLGLLSILRLLFSGKIINQPKHEDMLHVWNDLWPDILLSVAAFISLRVFLVRRPDRFEGTWWRRIVNWLTVALLLAFAMWMITDRASLTMMVHIAITGIEAAEPGWLQRPGVFPHHAMEGYWSFWVSTTASVGALLSALLLLCDGKIEFKKLQRISRTLFWLLVASLAGFAWWFASREFPRINPDMASVPTPRLWSDILAGGILWLGVAAALAVNSARDRNDSNEPKVEVPVSGLLVISGAVFASVAEAWFVIESIRVINPIAGLFGGPGSLIELIKTFGEFFSWPEIMLPLMVLVSALALLWQSIRRSSVTKPIPPISPRRFGYHIVAWAALLVVAVPAFWAFSMCYWLGPLVL